MPSARATNERRRIPWGMTDMSTALKLPTPELVKAACQQFDSENTLAEQTLTELFELYPKNDNSRHVLLKVVAVNSLYRTHIFALEPVAEHILLHHKDIDAALAAGSPEIVDIIAKIKIKGRLFNFFSFATKYASWHNPAKYPIYDSHVDEYLWKLQKQNHFTSFLHPDLWTYPKFLKVMTDFRSFHGLDNFSFKEIDKFLYLECAPHAPLPVDAQPVGPGAFDYYPAEEIQA
jgi:hypothetical protein